MLDAIWLVPALPLVGFLVLVFLGKRIGEPLSGWLATAMVFGSFVVSVLLGLALLDAPDHTFELSLFSWIPAGDFQVDIGFLLDPLSMTMILFVTGIASLIHLYSIGYMHGDDRFPTFFTYLNLFVFSMLMLILGNNLLVTFLGWEGVGACSYFLISFWFTKDANASAGKKAFVANRVGDWGFMIAMFATFLAFGSLNYTTVLPEAPGLAMGAATFIAVMLFVGAVGKSAQIPLFIWLPDAMAGPTPVSALIHAATMVTAGVYLMTRVNPLIAASYEWVTWLIAGIGALTLLVAATIGLAQTDIKKVLAYSTVSQLGYMFLAVGSGGYAAAIFHMVTHAFFKALLFLGAGSVIHGMHDEQDMRRMGALRKLMPITFGTYVIGWLAISGLPPFSGFWSKDEVLTYALNKSPVLYAVGLLGALLTAIYMGRQVFLVFYGEPHWNDPIPEDAPATAPADDADDAPAADATHAADAHDEHDEVHPHESSWLMTLPLIILAIGAALIGFINIPFGDLDFLTRWLEDVDDLHANEAHLPYSSATILLLIIVSTVVASLGLAIAWLTWIKGVLPRSLWERRFFLKAWYYDELVTRFMGGPGRALFEAIAWFDRTVIDGVVNGVGAGAQLAGRGLRRVQNGYVRSYALLITIGAILVIAFMFTRLLVR